MKMTMPMLMFQDESLRFCGSDHDEDNDATVA